jgi:hypothetical protein
MALIPFVTSHPNDTQYCPLLAPLNQTSQEVTHPGTTPAEARLTVSSDGIITITALKCVVVIEGRSIHISTSPCPGNVGRHNQPNIGEEFCQPFRSMHIVLNNNGHNLCRVSPNNASTSDQGIYPLEDYTSLAAFQIDNNK